MRHWQAGKPRRMAIRSVPCLEAPVYGRERDACPKNAIRCGFQGSASYNLPLGMRQHPLASEGGNR
jgi:hypothetical protein